MFESAKNLAGGWDRVFLYGDTGSGKTTQASFWPEPLFLLPATERSIDTLAGVDVLYKLINTPEEMTSVVLGLLQAQQKGGGKALPALTVVVESITHYSDMVVDQMTQNGRRPMEMKDWGVLRSHMLALSSNLARLEAHVVYTALADAPNLENSSPGHPKIQGSTRDLLPSSCRALIYMESRSRLKESTAFIAHTTNYKNYYARDRRRGIPPEIMCGDTFETSLYRQIFQAAAQ